MPLAIEKKSDNASIYCKSILPIVTLKKICVHVLILYVFVCVYMNDWSCAYLIVNMTESE